MIKRLPADSTKAGHGNAMPAFAEDENMKKDFLL